MVGSVFAIDYTYPTGTNVAIAPQPLNDTDTLTVSSGGGPFAATGSAANTINGTSAVNSTISYITVNSGGTISYAGTNPAAVTVQPTLTSGGGSSANYNITLANNGVISSGTGSATAIDVSGSTATNVWGIFNDGIINGNVILNNGTIIFGGSGFEPRINGNITFASNATAANILWEVDSITTTATYGSIQNAKQILIGNTGGGANATFNINYPIQMQSGTTNFLTCNFDGGGTVTSNATIDGGSTDVTSSTNGALFKVVTTSAGIPMHFVNNAAMSNMREIVIDNGHAQNTFTNNNAQLTNISKIDFLSAGGGTFTSSGNLQNFGTINVKLGNTLTFAGNITSNVASNSTSYGVSISTDSNTSNSATFNSVTFTVANNSINHAGGTMKFNGLVSFTGSGNTITNAASQTMFLNAGATGVNTLTNNGTLNIGGPVSTGAFSNNNSTGALYFISSGSISTGISGGTGLTIGRDSTGASNACNFTANGNISMPIITVYANSSLNTNGNTINGITSAFTVNSTGSATIDSTFTGTGAPTFTNNGSLTIKSGAAISGFTTLTNIGSLSLPSGTSPFSGSPTLSNSGSITPQGLSSLGSANYSGAGTIITSILAPGSNTGITTSGSININDGTVNISSSYTGSSVSTISWALLTAGSNITSNSGTTIQMLASNNLFSRWQVNPIVGNTLTVSLIPIAGSLVTNATTENNAAIAAVLSAMRNNVTNNGQLQLLTAILSAGTEAQYNYYLQQLIPNATASSTNLVMQSLTFNKLESRISAARQDSFTSMTGVSTGDIAPNTAMWLGEFGSIANQSLNQNNPGYKATAVGTIVGLDHQTKSDDIYGLAFAFSDSNIDQYGNTDFTTKMLGYSLLAYGTNQFMDRFLLEGMLSGTINDNSGSRRILINNQNMSITSSYRSWLTALRVNVNNFFDYDEKIRLSQLLMLQYVLVHQPAYNESNSVASLQVQPQPYNNVLTLGAGARLNYNYAYSWLCGNNELRALASYDVISTEQLTSSNFIVGSNSFVISAPSERLAIKLGADLGFAFYKNLILQLSYDLELRTKYNDNSGTVKLRYLF